MDDVVLTAEIRNVGADQLQVLVIASVRAGHGVAIGYNTTRLVVLEACRVLVAGVARRGHDDATQTGGWERVIVMMALLFLYDEELYVMAKILLIVVLYGSQLTRSK